MGCQYCHQFVPHVFEVQPADANILVTDPAALAVFVFFADVQAECVCCGIISEPAHLVAGRLVSTAEVEDILITGFYKVVMPLLMRLIAVLCKPVLLIKHRL